MVFEPSRSAARTQDDSRLLWMRLTPSEVAPGRRKTSRRLRRKASHIFSDAANKWGRNNGTRRPLTCVGSVVSLQLAALGEGLGAGQAVEDPRLLGAGGGARLVHPLVFLSADASVSVSASVLSAAMQPRLLIFIPGASRLREQRSMTRRWSKSLSSRWFEKCKTWVCYFILVFVSNIISYVFT